MKPLYEPLGETYREENGHLVPKLELPEQTNDQIGKYGQFYLEYLKKTLSRKVHNTFDRRLIVVTTLQKLSLHTLLNSICKSPLKS